MITNLARAIATVATRLVAIDPRSMAAARIVLAVILTLDLCQRLTDVEALYSGGGALPLSVVRERYPEAWRWSLHWLSGAVLFNAAVLTVALVAAVALVLGAWTRAATIASWFLLVSLHHRLAAVNNAGDLLLALLLFWGMFLPWGRRWSMDALWKRRSPSHVAFDEQPVVTWATAAILLQVALMYGMSGYFKQHEMWRSGDALQYILAFDAYGRSGATWLLKFPGLVKLLSFATVWLENVGPWLFFFPWFTGPLRVVLCILFFLLHIGIAASLTVGWFSYICMGALLLFVPAGVWDSLGRWIPAISRRVPAPEQTDVSSPAPAWIRIARGALAVTGLVLLGLVITWNIDAARRANLADGAKPPPRIIPQWLAKPMMALGLSQNWNMFARPTEYDDWFTAWGRLANGETRDIWTGGIARDPMQSPPNPSGMFANHRWRKLFQQLTLPRNRSLRASVGRWLVTRWNQSHAPEEQIVFFALEHTAERIYQGENLTRLVVTRWYSEGDDWLNPGYEFGDPEKP